MRIAHEKLATFEYRQQAEVLNERDEDIYVAEYSVYELDGGDVRSLSLWNKGVDTVLRKTAWIYLAVPNPGGGKLESVVPVPWDAVADRFTEVPGLHPPRFRTTGAFPDATELATLRARYGDLR